MTCSHDDFQTARSVLCLDNTELGFSNNRAGYRSYDAEKCPEQNAGPGDYITKIIIGYMERNDFIHFPWWEEARKAGVSYMRDTTLSFIYLC